MYLQEDLKAMASLEGLSAKTQNRLIMSKLTAALIYGLGFSFLISLAAMFGDIILNIILEVISRLKNRKH